MTDQLGTSRFSGDRPIARRPLTWIPVLTVLAALSGCASTGGLVPPEVTLVNVELVDATIFESTFDIEVRITNDNLEPLTIDGAVVKLELDGRKFGRGASADRVEIPRMGSVVQRMELHLSHVAVATKIRSVIESKTVNYTINGSVYVVGPSGRTKRLPVTREGTIDLSGGSSWELPVDANLAEPVEG